MKEKLIKEKLSKEQKAEIKKEIRSFEQMKKKFKKALLNDEIKNN